MTSRQVHRAALAVAGAGVATAAVLAARRLDTLLAASTPLTPYKEPQWWLDYDAGFVRRGLPGEVLTWVAGGAPDRGLVAAAGLSLTLAAVLAAVALAVALARSAPSRAAALLVATVVLASPFTVALLLQDLGRYDGAGVLALALLALPLGWGRLPRRAVVLAVATVVAGATAAQELLLPVLAPVAVARLGGLRARPGAAAAALAPAAVVAGASALLPAPAAVADARAAARAAGVPHPGGWGDALDAADRTLTENLAFFEFFEPAALLWSSLLWAGLYAATAVVLGRLLGRGDDRGWWALAAWQAAVAVGLSLLGVDFRRWWGLALLGLVAAACVAPRRARADAPEPGAVAAGAALVAVGLWAADVPVFPLVPTW